MKKIEVGQTVVFVKPQFKSPARVKEYKVLKVGRLYFTLDDHSRYPTRISLDTHKEVDCNNNVGQVYMSMAEYEAERHHNIAARIINMALRRDNRIIDRATTATLLQVAELLGIDMKELEEARNV